MARFLTSHCQRLERLTISNGIQIHETDDSILVTKLDFLAAHDPVAIDYSGRICTLLKLNQNNLTKLDLNFIYIDEVSGLTLNDLEMPSLKQLRFNDSCSFKLIQCNAEHLETLIFNNCSAHRSYEMHLPESLPKLTTLVR